MTAYTSASFKEGYSSTIVSGEAPSWNARITVSSVTRVPATRTTPSSSVRIGTGSAGALSGMVYPMVREDATGRIISHLGSTSLSFLGRMTGTCGGRRTTEGRSREGQTVIERRISSQLTG